jgi:hypothetical protein
MAERDVQAADVETLRDVAIVIQYLASQLSRLDRSIESRWLGPEPRPVLTLICAEEADTDAS